MQYTMYKSAFAAYTYIYIYLYFDQQNNLCNLEIPGDKSPKNDLPASWFTKLFNLRNNS